jgi:phage-related protein
MEDKPRFKIVYSSEVADFLKKIDVKASAKILYDINRSRYVLDKELFKKLIGTDIWEFRTMYKGVKYRVLSFWDTRNDALVIATHGFVKKSAKTPRKEINRAEMIRNEYFKQNK